MELQHVRAFLAVAEELHFGRAAQRLHLTQPRLSRSIQQLERQLGSPLFERTSRRVRLTAEGEALLDPARAVLQAVADAERAVVHAAAGEVGRVRLGFAGPSSHEPVVDLARAVRTRSPGIELELASITYGTEVVSRLLAHELDLAIVRLTATPPGLATRVLRKEHLAVALPDSHPLADRDELTMDELADESWVALSASTGSILRSTLAEAADEAGFVPRVVQHAQESWTIMALVAAGAGISLTLDTAAPAADPQRVRMVPLRGGRTTWASLAWRADDTSAALARVLAIAEDVVPTPDDAPDPT